MDKIKELKQLLEDEVLVEVNETINELEEQMANKKKSKSAKEELEYMQQVKQYFDEVLIDIEHNKLKQEDAIEILKALEEMEMDNLSDF